MKKPTLLVAALAVMVLLVFAFQAGQFWRDWGLSNKVAFRQIYGSLEKVTDDSACIRTDEEGRVCAEPRLPDRDAIPPVGSCVRGGYAVVPQDSDYADDAIPSWLWLTKLAC